MTASNSRKSLTFKIYQRGALVGEQTLDRQVIKVGTLTSAHLQIEDDSVSRMHAYIQMDGSGDVQISDLGSARGTLLNGRRINKAKLQSGDRLRLGDTELVVTMSSAAVATAVPSLAAAPASMASSAPPVPGVPAVPTASPTPAARGIQRTSSYQHTELSSEDLDTVEHSDGSRSVEVVALYQDSAHVVKHFSNPKAGKVRTGSLVALAVGLCLALGGAFAFGSQIYSVKRQEAHQAKTKEFIQDRGLPMKFVPKVRTNRTAEVVGASGFALGLFWMLFGMLRTRDDLRKPRFTVGEHPRCTFHTPIEALPPGLAEFPLVQSTQGAFQLAYTPKMDGMVELPGHEPMHLSALVEKGIAQPSSEVEGAYQLPITEGLKAKVRFGDNSFQINTVASAKAVTGAGMPAAVAGVATKPISLATMGSGAVVGLFLLLFSFRPAEAGAFDADGMESSKMSRMVRSEMKNARKEENAKPKPPKDKPQVTENSKFKGPSGKSDPRLNNKRSTGPVSPNNSANNTAVGRSAGMGMAGVMQSMSKKLGSMFSRNAVSSDAEDALGALIGNAVGDNAGLDGLGINGGGRTGGGNGAGVEGPGGWNLGKGGGQGWGPAGGSLRNPFGGKPVGKYRPKGPVVYSTRFVSQGGIDAATIKRVIRRHINQIKYCYMTKGLSSNPRLKGLYKVSFTINSRGRVQAVRTAQTTLNHPPTEACIRGMVKTWRFPKPEGSMPYVVYPFHFKPSGK